MKDQTFEIGKWRRNGNVARLPKAVRARINEMLEDGLTYPAIIQALGEDGKGLDSPSLSRWKNGGYRDWLVERTFVEVVRNRQETPGELAKDFDASETSYAALQLAMLQMFEALRDLSPTIRVEEIEGAEPTEAEPEGLVGGRDEASTAEQEGAEAGGRRSGSKLDFRLGGDSGAFVRLIHALSRATRETLVVQKYREACSKARALLEPLKDLNRKLEESETRAIVRQVDAILGLRSIGDVGNSEMELRGPMEPVRAGGSVGVSNESDGADGGGSACP